MVNLPRGVMVALVTPFDESGDLDLAGLDRVVKRVLSANVAGISPTGSTGEGARLSRAQRLRVTEAVRSRVPAGFPVISGLPVTAVEEAVGELRDLADAGASAALVAPSFYYPADDGDVEWLYRHLADASPIPLLLYNIPVFTKVSISVAVVESLAEHPRIVGIKDSSRDFEYHERILYATDAAEFHVLTGSDTLLLPSLLLGAAGCIAGSLNLVPEISVALYDAVRRSDMDAAASLQRRLFTIVQACRRGASPAGWKAALEIAGLCSARLAPPASRLPDDLYHALKADLDRLL